MKDLPITRDSARRLYENALADVSDVAEAIGVSLNTRCVIRFFIT